MHIQLDLATAHDVLPLVALRAAVAEKLTTRHGQGAWSHTSTEKGTLLEMRTSQVFVARADGRLIATLRLAKKKPWAIDLQYFRKSRRPVYLLSMAVRPELQQQGVGRRCMEEAISICRQWSADAVRLDAYDASAGAGPFYEKCGFNEVGRRTYRGCPLVYYEKILQADNACVTQVRPG